MVIGRVVYVLTGGPAFCLPHLLPLLTSAAGIQASRVVVVLPGVGLWLPSNGRNSGVLDPGIALSHTGWPVLRRKRPTSLISIFRSSTHSPG